MLPPVAVGGIGSRSLGPDSDRGWCTVPTPINGPYLTEAFNSPVCNRLLAYWRSKKTGPACPALADIDLMEIHDIAPVIALCDAVDGGAEFVARFYGTGIVDVFGFDRTGKTVAEGFPPEKVEMIVARHRLPYESGEPARVVGYLTAVGKDYPFAFEAIYLPLRGTGDAIAHVVSAYDFDYEPTAEDGIAYEG